MAKRKGCGDPECGCERPTLTDPVQALNFLMGRMRYAGVGEGAALAYAADIEEILKDFDITFTKKVANEQG